MKKILLSIVVAGAFLVSCNDEFLDPTKPFQEEVLSTRSGLIGATNGLQQLWSNGRASVLYTSITANGLTTVIFQNGKITTSSRRYLKKIKERLS